ncbi:hypothetical protein ANCCAN_18792 [Ancylostoma caninum]|uniref:Uncharacterized protein n=1 Tax=Ancylostoma caninum TaxID=29170 RepID=A0A368FSZ6_ANCCA|nr:hypothetical protein ANCCAN_18792 [Ancylostoma caninum]
MVRDYSLLLFPKPKRVPAFRFEWVLAGYARPRETIGFHHHRIAKYDLSRDEAFYGDANLRERIFKGVSPISRFFNELSSPDQFIRKIWVLRRKPEREFPDYSAVSKNLLPFRHCPLVSADV